MFSDLVTNIHGPFLGCVYERIESKQGERTPSVTI